MGRGTNNMYAPLAPGDKRRCLVGQRPKASIWKSKNQWYSLGGCCWTGWVRNPITEKEAFERLEACRKRIVEGDSSYGFDSAYWSKLRERVAKCSVSQVAYWAASFGVQIFPLAKKTEQHNG